MVGSRPWLRAKTARLRRVVGSAENGAGTVVCMDREVVRGQDGRADGSRTPRKDDTAAGAAKATVAKFMASLLFGSGWLLQMGCGAQKSLKKKVEIDVSESEDL
jgi:hypothetical protein